MLERVPRFMLALAAIVACAVVFIAVRDYMQQRREVKAPASATAPAATQANDATAAKKTAAAKAKRAQASASHPSTHRTVQHVAAADDAGNSSAPSLAGVAPVLASDTAASSLGAAQSAEQAAEEPATEGAVSGGNRLRSAPNSKVGRRSDLSAGQCVPLPNGTDPRDVDAHYYRNWAREYSCQI